MTALSQEVFPGAAEKNEFICEVDYDASLLLGDSAHHAQIVVDENDKKWVMKSQDVSYGKALNELNMLDRFQREGVPTLPLNGARPFIVKAEDEKDSATLFLPFISGLQPLTRLDWAAHVGTDSYERRREDLSLCIRLAAKMHLRGFTHGDFQVKNIGLLRSGKIVAFDLENSHEFPQGSLQDSRVIQEKSDDLVSLFKSVRLNGLFTDTNPDIRRAEISDILFGYCEKMNLSEDSIEVVERAEKQIFEWIEDPDRITRALSRFVINKT